MNKSFSLFLNQLKKLNLPKGKYAIFGSGPLGIRNIRDAHDLDLIVGEELFNKYKGMPCWEFKSFERDGRYVEMIENSGIEFYKNWGPGNWDTRKLINEAEFIDNLPFVRLEEVKKWKKISGREKDLKDVKLIEKYLQKSEKQK
ncbi:hypothetical protein COY23_03855 [bacterium (Candidatus Torokbacteria) CG_4_10_14_0_2_um_filter_35_8]|nr:MAG: hypothetical protein COY23_03855 [bacterium (Candidatus Torokbacteria) CG_4_10_14_0_2_um_filter_35_8]